MALVSEASCDRRIRQTQSLFDQPTGVPSPAIAYEGRWRKAGLLLEVTYHLKPRHPSRTRQPPET
jgi:hypothetical protein